MKVKEKNTLEKKCLGKENKQNTCQKPFLVLKINTVIKRYKQVHTAK